MKLLAFPLPMRLGTTMLAALLSLGLFHPAWAQWKWRDQAGRVQYSDLPPPHGVKESEILQRPTAATRVTVVPIDEAASAAAASAMATAASGPKVDPQLEAKRRKLQEEEAAKRKEVEDKINAARAENCTHAKTNLRALEEGTRISRINEKGEREVLDDQSRAEEAKRTRSIITTDCQ